MPLLKKSSEDALPVRVDGRRSYEQALLWIPENRKETNSSGFKPPISVQYPFGSKNRPLLWTLPDSDRSNPPKLPMVPKHGTNAYIDNFNDDWRIAGSTLTYYSHYGTNEGGHWVLLEFPVGSGLGTRRG